MALKSVFAAVAAALLLTGCSSSAFGFLLGGGISIADAEAAELALIDRVDDILIAEGDTLTAELPVAGTARYIGIIHGMDGGGGTGPDLVYYADMYVDVDFATDTLDGEVTNFVTDLAGFENPTGTAVVAGTIGDNGGLAGIDFVAAGALSGTTGAADYSTSTTSGTFAGDTAQAAYGDHISDFMWVAGPNITTNSISDGDWNIEQ
ncbi:MAG: hypothetical protein ACR2OY_03255 [Boseongicola sp.]